MDISSITGLKRHPWARTKNRSSFVTRFSPNFIRPRIPDEYIPTFRIFHHHLRLREK